MYITPSPLTQLKRIYDLLEHPAIDHHDIYRRVQTAFRDVNYRWPRAIVHYGGFLRASKLYAPESFAPEIERLSYPPTQYAGLGRCNWAGEPMFYCSTENGVPIFEIRAEQGDVFAMSRWVRNDCSVENTDGYPIILSPSIIGIDRIITTLRDGDTFIPFLQELNSRLPAEIREVDTFLGELFAKPYGSVPNLYWFTSAVSRILLNDLRETSTGKGLDGIMYPSVQSKFTGVNLAIKPSFVDKYLKLQSSAVYQIMEHDDPAYRYSIAVLRGLRNKDATTGKAIWGNVHPADAHRRWDLYPSSDILYTQTPPVLRYEDKA